MTLDPGSFAIPLPLRALVAPVLDAPGVGAAGLRAVALVAHFLEGLLAVRAAADYVRGILRCLEGLRGRVSARGRTLGVPEVFVSVEPHLPRSCFKQLLKESYEVAGPLLRARRAQFSGKKTPDWTTGREKKTDHRP